MDDFFGNPWRSLTIDQVEAFLADAGDEGLTWEATGTERPRPESVLRHVSAFANTDGGFYIVGATRDQKNAGPWHLDPIDFGDEPDEWFSRVVRNGLVPLPRFKVKEFPINGKHVAIVNVDPVPEPPCMTRTGQVFTRVPGESSRIEDPITLRRLHERGEARARAAEAEALRGAGRLFNGPPHEDAQSYLYVAYALAPVGRADDIAGVLFTHQFFQEIDAASERLPASSAFPHDDRPAFELDTRQDALLVVDKGGSNHQRWSLIASWDGSVTIAHEVRPDLQDNPSMDSTDVFASIVRPAEAAAAYLVTALGGHGRCHAVLRVHGRAFRLGSIQGHFGEVPGPDGILPIETWTPGDGRLATAQFDRMRRELVRACGVLVYEPVEEPGRNAD